MRSLIILSPLLCACPGPGEDSEGVPLDVEALVAAALEESCSAGSLDALAEAEPSAVRAALVAAHDASQEEWAAGQTFGHPIEVELGTALLQDFQFDYTLHLPEGFDPDSGELLPLYVEPAHPTYDLQEQYTLPWYDSMAPEPFAFIMVNFYNRLYIELSEEDYYSDELGTITGYHDYFAAIDASIADVLRHWPVDGSKVYIGGVSAMGNSAWFNGIFSTAPYAALNPISAGTAGFDEQLWRNLENTGLLVTHGYDDDIVSIDGVIPTVEMLEEWGFDIEFWDMKGEGHGTMFSAVYGDILAWDLERQRSLTPTRVHKGIKLASQADAFWLAATEFSVELPADATAYPSVPPAVMDASWEGGSVTIDTTGVSALELRWLEGELGAGSARDGDEVEVDVNGLGAAGFTLVEDPTVALEDYCLHGDIQRLWAGRQRISVP